MVLTTDKLIYQREVILFLHSSNLSIFSFLPEENVSQLFSLSFSLLWVTSLPCRSDNSSQVLKAEVLCLGQAAV